MRVVACRVAGTAVGGRLHFRLCNRCATGCTRRAAQLVLDGLLEDRLHDDGLRTWSEERGDIGRGGGCEPSTASAATEIPLAPGCRCGKSAASAPASIERSGSGCCSIGSQCGGDAGMRVGGLAIDA